MMAEARKKGVTGVPFTIIDGRWAVIGGQTAEVYIQVRVTRFARGGRVPDRWPARAQIFKKLAETEKVVPNSGVESGPVCSIP